MRRDFRLGEEVVFFSGAAPTGCRTHMVGIQPGQFLILTLPKGHPVIPALKAGDSVLAQTLSFPVCQFNSHVLRIIDEPPLLLLACPSMETIRQVQRRKSERRKVLLPGRCWSLDPEGNQLLWEGYILDISVTGCLILGDLAQRLGKRVRLVFRIPWGEGSIRLPARVVRTATGEKGMQSGLEFVELDEALQTKLDEVVGSLQEGGIARLFSPDETEPGPR